MAMTTLTADVRPAKIARTSSHRDTPTQPANRHGEWLAERTDLQAQAEAMCDADDSACETLAYDRLCNAMLVLEGRILTTPATHVAEAQAKLRLAAIIYAEGMMLEANDAAMLLSEIAPFFAGER